MLGPYVKPVPPSQNGFSHGLLWKCRVVLRQSRELAQQALDGKIALHAAFNEAERGNPGGTVNSKGVHMTDKPKEIEILSDGRDMFAVVDGVRIAKRGRPGTPEAGTWVTLMAGWTVTGGGPEDDEILITHDGGRVH
jgi:hypothetical protein